MPPLTGPVVPEIADAFARGLLGVPERPTGLQTSAVREDWFIPIIRVEFTDSAIVHTKAALERRLFDSTNAEPTGSMYDYYRWVSGRRIRVRGEVVATVRLPHDRNYYAADAWGVNSVGSPNNDYGMFREAVTACDGTVDFSRFDLDGDGYVDMLWLVHAGPGAETTGNRRDMWSITSRATAGWSNGSPADCNDLVPGSLTLHIRIDRFTVVPELSGLHPGQLNEIGVFCHEFGHTLGLPDLYDTTLLGGAANTGPGNWALMSSGAYGGDGLSPESPSHLGAWCSLWLGWTSRVRPTQDTTLTLAPLADGTPLLEFWFQGEDSPEHFLLENRVRESFDRKLPNDGLLVHQIDEAVIGQRITSNRINTGPTPGMRVLEADGQFDLYTGLNRGDASDPFPGSARRTRIDDLSIPSTRTFSGLPTNISIEDVARVGRNVSLRLRVRAPGWQSSRDVSGGAGQPGPTIGAATRAVVSPAGRSWLVSSEVVAGRNAIVVRERPWLQDWGPAMPIDRGLGSAEEPALARFPGDNLAAAWIERDGGRGRVCYRARVLGRWGNVRVFDSTSGDCLAPAIAADARGRVFLSWLELIDDHVTLRFMQFLYNAPYGTPTNVTVAADLPAPPTLTAAGDGRAYLLWPDAGSGVHAIYACRFNPDSGLSARFRLTPASAYTQPAVSAVVDTTGMLYTVWQVNPGSGGEIHFQRRGASGRPSPRDTTIDALGNGLQNPRIAVDPTGGLHVAYERLVPSGAQVRYKRWRPVLGWDVRATEVSDASDLNVTGIDLLPTSSGNVDVTWIGFDGISQRLRERARTLDGSLVTSVDEPPVPAIVSLTVGPNPLRAGESLELHGADVVDGVWIELVDAAGRRIASVRADAAGRARFGSETTRSLAAGLYFARVRGGTARGRFVVLR
jgi:immune inhibitor A